MSDERGATATPNHAADDGHEIHHYLCIGCPLGCRLEVEAEDDEIVEVRGFSCKRGVRFAEQEFHDPRRDVSTTVAIDGARWARLPVKTAAPIPKAQVQALCARLHEVRLEAPVRMGDVVLADVLGTGIDVVATRDLERMDVAG
jgi:CxxC motif-containing protein